MWSGCGFQQYGYLQNQSGDHVQPRSALILGMMVLWIGGCNGQAVYSTGYNYGGRLGLGDTTERWTPTLITAGGLSTVSIKAISAGLYHSLMLSNSGFVYSVGANEYGRLGLGDTTYRWTPTLITAGGLSTVSITAISAGYIHSLMLSNTGSVYSTAYNYNGELGLGDTADRWTPTLITAGGLSTVTIKAISAGWFFSLLLSSTGSVYSTGTSPGGQLGLGDTTDRWTPTLITAGGLSSVNTTAISAKGFHSLMLSNTGVVYSTGTNPGSQLCLGDTTDRWTPTLITAGGLSSISITAISAGGFIDSGTSTLRKGHSLFLSSSGKVYGCGTNVAGELALGDTTMRTTATLMTAGALSSILMTSVSSGWSGNQANDARADTMFIASSNDVYSAGSNNHGQLGIGDTTDRYTATLLSTLTASNLKSYAISAQFGYSIVLADINECTSNTHNCNTNANCTNTISSFTCSCNVGYTGNGVSCNDINECTSNTHNCNTNAACTNTISSFTCSCNVGYNGNGVSCADINECTSNTHNCNTNAACTNTISSFTCSCNVGYNGNGLSCADVNECTSNTHNCNTNATCTNTAGSFTCSCNVGYNGNGVSCVDINECTSNIHNCNINAACTNTAGSFACSCNTDYQGNGTFCANCDFSPKIVLYNTPTTITVANAISCTSLTLTPTSGPSYTVSLTANAAVVTLTLQSTLHAVAGVCEGKQFTCVSQVYSSPVSDLISMTMALDLVSVGPDNIKSTLKSNLMTVLSLNSTDQVAQISVSSGSAKAQFYLAQANPSSPSPSTLVSNLKTAASNGTLKTAIPTIQALTAAGVDVTIGNGNNNAQTTSTTTTITSTTTTVSSSTSVAPTTTTAAAGANNALSTTTAVNNIAATTQSTAVGETPKPDNSTGAIIGGVIGGVVGLAIIGAFAYFKFLRKPKLSASGPAFFEIHQKTSIPSSLAQILPALHRLIHLYCKKVGVSETAAEAFYKALEGDALLSNTANMIDKMAFLGTYFWTSARKLQEKPTEFCGILQYALREDNRELLQHACVIIRAINELCVTRLETNTGIPWPSDFVLYRGGGLPEHHRTFFTLDKKFRFKGYFATSANWEVARTFLQKSNEHPPVLWIVNIDRKYKCVHVNYVGQVGALGNKEAEFLFVPYSVFTVKNAYYNEQHHHYIISLDAAVDNSKEPMDLEYAPWY